MVYNCSTCLLTEGAGTLTSRDVWVSEFGDGLIEQPRAHLRMTLAQDERGLVLTYQDREVLRCYLNRMECSRVASSHRPWESSFLL